MRVDGSPAQSILNTGSFTGWRPIQQLGSGYLTATKTKGQPLCGNEEGWGPISPHRYDFTPCFMDVWVSSVAVFGIIGGALAVWYLFNWKKAQEVKKDWHFWLKQVRTFSQLGQLRTMHGLYIVQNYRRPLLTDCMYLAATVLSITFVKHMLTFNLTVSHCLYRRVCCWSTYSPNYKL